MKFEAAKNASRNTKTKLRKVIFNKDLPREKETVSKFKPTGGILAKNYYNCGKTCLLGKRTDRKGQDPGVPKKKLNKKL